MKSNPTISTKRLLVIKHGALGDMVQGFDSFASLREGHKGAYIAILTTPPFAGLATMMPWFDNVIIDRRAGITNILESLRIRKLLRGNWDFIIDLQCSRRTAFYFKFFVRPDVRWIGTVKGCSDPCPDFTGVNNHKRMLIASEIAGGKQAKGNLEWLLKGPISGVSHSLTGLYVILVAGCSASKPEKRWPSQKFSELALVLQAKGYLVVLVGTKADKSVVEEVEAGAPNCINLCGKTSIEELAILFSSSSGVIGNDTGPVFLAAASGAPTIMLMGPDTEPCMSAPTGELCDWIKGTPINSIDVGDVVERLTVLF